MSTKHFIIDPTITSASKETLDEIEKNKVLLLSESQSLKDKINNSLSQSAHSLKHVFGRVVVMVNMDNKNFHQFENGPQIRIERKFNNFNRRETEPVNCIVISSDQVPAGTEILVGHNALHDTNRIFNYLKTSGAAEATDIRFYSLPESDCFAFRDEKGEIQPMKGFAFGLRVYKPYNGALIGIEPSLVKEVLFITTGEYKGNVCHVLKASDYQMVYQDTNGREANTIRCRHFEGEENEREEIICVNHELTNEVINGSLVVGLSEADAKQIQ